MEAKESFVQKVKINQSKKVYQGRQFSFVVEDMTLPNNTRTKMGMVRHPGSATVIPLRDDGTVVMVRQYRHAVRDFLLETPAGTMEPGESPLDCARRELKEETGLEAEEFIKLTAVHILPAYTDEIIHVYLAKHFSQTEQHLDQDEILELVEFPLGQVMKMIRNGTVTDALTILSIQMAWIYQKNEKR